MRVPLVFNELCLDTQARDWADANRLMSELLATIQEAVRCGAQEQLYVPMQFHSLALYDEYSVYDWAQDRRADRDERLYLLTLTTKGPFLPGDDHVEADGVLVQCHVGHQYGHGLTFAYVRDALAIGMCTSPEWDTHEVPLVVTELSDDGERQSAGRVRHLSRPAHAQSHREWLELQQRSDIADGEALWSWRDDVLSRLEFTVTAEQQLRSLRAADALFTSVLSRLVALQDYCLDWHSGSFDSSQIRFAIHDESEPTLQQFGEERKFRCPDGVSRVFRLHMLLSPNAWRLHFFPLPEQRRVIVGYIGPHLRTARHRN